MCVWLQRRLDYAAGRGIWGIFHWCLRQNAQIRSKNSLEPQKGACIWQMGYLQKWNYLYSNQQFVIMFKSYKKSIKYFAISPKIKKINLIYSDWGGELADPDRRHPGFAVWRGHVPWQLFCPSHKFRWGHQVMKLQIALDTRKHYNLVSGKRSRTLSSACALVECCW